MQCHMVTIDATGVIDLQQPNEVEDWAEVQAVATKVERVEDLMGWAPYTAHYIVRVPWDPDPLHYLVAE